MITTVLADVGRPITGSLLAKPKHAPHRHSPQPLKYRRPANEVLSSQTIRSQASCRQTRRLICQAQIAQGSSPQQSPEDAAAAAEDEREQREIERLREGMSERRAVDRSERLQENPYSPVESAMTSPAVTTSPDTLVGSLLESLEHFTGMPVVNKDGKCIGILSSSDIFEHQRRASPSITHVRVRDVMTSPAVVIVEHAPIAYAAGLMLKHKVHRLPVVNGSNVVVGIVTRTDIYEPLIPAVNPIFHRLLGVEEVKEY